MIRSICYLLFFGVVCTVIGSCKNNNSNANPSSIDAVQNVELIDAQVLYINNCVTCHGIDGKLGAAGAKNLSETKLSTNGIVEQITNGKGVMPPFGDKFSNEEIKAIAAYVITELKTN
ncbi:MAG TPA: cytochrome c [Fluviicola sp.]|nr:cytochrome c [Fluviicola sp.]